MTPPPPPRQGMHLEAEREGGAAARRRPRARGHLLPPRRAGWLHGERDLALVGQVGEPALSPPASQPASRVGALAVVITQQPARDNSITRVGACSYFGTHGNLAARLWAEGWQHVRQQQVSWGVGLGAAARRHDH